MAILFRTISPLIVNGMEARLTVYRNENRLRVELEPYNSATTTAYTSALQATVAYNGGTETLNASPFTKKAAALFPYADNVRQITLSASSISYHGTTASSVTIPWQGNGTVAPPKLAISSFSGLLIGQPARVEWTVSDVPAGYTASNVGIWMYFASENKMLPTYQRSVLVSGKSEITAFEHTPSLAEKNVLYYRIAVGVYPSTGGGAEDYVAYAEIDTPAYICSGSSLYTLAACNVRYPSVVAKGCPITIRWDLLAAATHTGRVILQYSYNQRNAWYDICTLSDMSIRSWQYTITQDWTTIGFRVTATSTRNLYERALPAYGGKWAEIGKSNIYVGRNGVPVLASLVQVGSSSDSPYTGGYATVGE